MGLETDKSDDDSFQPMPKKRRHLSSEKKSSRGNEDINHPAFIMDCGGHTAKLGYSTAKSPKVIPNCIMKVKSERRRPFIGDQIDDCRDLSGLFYILPMQRGFILNWDVQKPVWDYMFGRDCCNVRYQDTPFIITEPICNFTSIQEATNEILFEEYGIPSIFKGNSTDFAAYQFLNHPKASFQNNMDSCMVLDTGFSFTHVVPYINKRKYWPGVRRIDIGGKILTNHLKEIISYRQLHVMDETHVINQAKEDTCFVSLNFENDMQVAGSRRPENTIIKEYVLPDYSTIKRGYVQEVKAEAEEDSENGQQQTLRLNNERFTVPEILFHPSDIGLSQMGIAETIVNSIYSCEARYRAYMVKNIVVGGGNVKFPGFTVRLPKEIKKLCPTEWDCYVSSPLDPVTFAWRAAAKLSKDPNFKNMCVTRQDYEEHGNRYVDDHFKYMVYNNPLRLEVVKDTRSTEDSPAENEQEEVSHNVFEKRDGAESAAVGPQEEEDFDDDDERVEDSPVQKPSPPKTAKQKQEMLIDKELLVTLDKADVENIIIRSMASSATALKENYSVTPVASSTIKRSRFRKTLANSSESGTQLTAATPVTENSANTVTKITAESQRFKSNTITTTTTTVVTNDAHTTTSKTIFLPSKAFIIPNLKASAGQITTSPRKGLIFTTSIPNRTVTIAGSANKPIILQNIRLQTPIANPSEYFQRLSAASGLQQQNATTPQHHHQQQQSLLIKTVRPMHQDKQPGADRLVQTTLPQLQQSLLLNSSQQKLVATTESKNSATEEFIIFDPTSDNN